MLRWCLPSRGCVGAQDLGCGAGTCRCNWYQPRSGWRAFARTRGAFSRTACPTAGTQGRDEVHGHPRQQRGETLTLDLPACGILTGPSWVSAGKWGLSVVFGSLRCFVSAWGKRPACWQGCSSSAVPPARVESRELCRGPPRHALPVCCGIYGR